MIEVSVSELFAECDKLVIERGEKYGSIEETFSTLACLWSIRSNTQILPSDVCDMLEDLKYIRSKKTPAHHDNGADAVNYKSFAYLLREKGM